MSMYSHSIRQAAALPLQNGNLCTITSSNGKRWIIPKGLIGAGQTAGESALQEAWEEAGVVGFLHPEPVGSYLYEKYGNTYHVIVFVMEVTEVAEDWPERAIRQRRWVSPARLLERIAEPGLRDLLRSVLDKQHAAP
jgi:8-oxo-dGTP pyrophosphatase MutT (NUDIX family)